MKKSKLTGLLLLPVVVLPIALSLSSCADLSNSLYDVSNARNGEITHDSNLVDLKISNASLHSLLWGDKNFHNGNYVVFVTHSYHDEASGLLGTYTKFTKEVVNDLKINSKDNSLLRAIESMSDSDYGENIDIGFVVLVEQDIKVDGDANRPNYPYEEDKPCDPYSSGTDEDHELNDNHKAGTYVRNDGDATAYRTLMSEISKVFSGGSNISNDFFGMQGVKGYPITDTMVSSDNISSCFNFLTGLRTNYEKGTDGK